MEKPISPALQQAGFRIFACDLNTEEPECCWCSKVFQHGEDVYWSDDGMYGDSAEAHCRRHAYDSAIRPFGNKAFYSRMCGKTIYNRNLNKLLNRPDYVDRMRYHR